MASIPFVFICLILLANLVVGYRLYDTDDAIDGQTHHPINMRSVLWPKICFTTYIKKSEGTDWKNNDHQQQQRASRNLRKCYPLDTA